MDGTGDRCDAHARADRGARAADRAGRRRRLRSSRVGDRELSTRGPVRGAVRRVRSRSSRARLAGCMRMAEAGRAAARRAGRGHAERAAAAWCARPAVCEHRSHTRPEALKEIPSVPNISVPNVFRATAARPEPAEDRAPRVGDLGRRDPRDDHVDPRHDDRQRRARHALEGSAQLDLAVQWVVTGYLLALAAVMPVTGWMARRFGAKRVYLVSLRAVHARLGRLRVLEHARRARRLPRAAGHRRRHDHAARAADHGPGRRARSGWGG